MGTVPMRKDDKVFRIINNVLEGVFGDEATRLIYGHLERRYSLRQSEISGNMDVFAKGLEDFVSDGVLSIENKILNDILSACRLESGGVSFQIAVPEGSDSAGQIGIVASNT
jgi:hypothetical protein